MNARHRSALMILLVVVALFAVRWPIEEHICNPNTWKWRPSPTDGVNFFSSVFRGGGGTPAVFAMLGGQRNMVASIMWNYSDVLFHKGKLYEMVPAMESTVTLDPTFTEAWSTYSWHLAWNIYSYTDDPVEKQRWLQAGIVVSRRAIQAAPTTPKHYEDLARLYQERVGNDRKAMEVLEPVVVAGQATIGGKTYHFKPLTPAMQKKYPDDPAITDKYWDTYFVGHRMGIIYYRIGIFTGDWEYIKKAIKVYERCLEINPKDRTAPTVIARYKQNMYNEKWMKSSRDTLNQVRNNFGIEPILVPRPLEEIYPDGEIDLYDSK